MSYPIDTVSWRSPNYNSRGGEPIGSIVVHSCEGAHMSSIGARVARMQLLTAVVQWLCAFF